MATNIGSMIEYAQIPADSSTRVDQIAQGVMKQFRRDCYLIHSTEGYEPAGSMARWTNEYYAVIFYDASGSRNGRRFKASDKAQAEALFSKWTAE